MERFQMKFFEKLTEMINTPCYKIDNKSMDMNDHEKIKLLRKLLDDVGRECAYDRTHYWSLQLDSGMVAEVRFVEPATLPVDEGRVCPTCKSSCRGAFCPHHDGRCCDVCAHYNGGKLTETCHHCSMLSHWQDSELTEEELESLMDDDIMPIRCTTCVQVHADGSVFPCNGCYRSFGSEMWEPKD